MLMLVCVLPFAVAGEVPSAPILRIETGHHTAFIQALAYEPRQQRLVTVSDDKTIRVWQLPELTPVATHRVPIAPGYEGQLYTAALSPDGRTLAVAGWTGWHWDNKGAIYLLDLGSGDITRRLTGFDEAIGPLAFSPDGKYLALGLLGKQGLHVLETEDYSEIAWDIDYRDKTIGLVFTPQGGLISTSLDGYVRLYDRDFQLAGRVKTGLAGTRPFGASLSPDGRKIAFGFHDVPAVSVLSASDLSPLYSAHYTELKQQANLTTVAWSADGQALYAGGDGGAGPSPIYRIADGGRGEVRRIAEAEARVSQVGVLPGGEIVYVAEDPAIAVLDPASGRRLAYVGPDIADFRGSDTRFRVSHDGSAVQFSYGARAGKFGRYSAAEQTLRSSAAEDTALSAPLLHAPGLTVSEWKNAERPRINGTPVQLDDHELARSYAITPDRRHVVFGTEWALRLYDEHAAQKWWVKLPATAWAVNVSGDGRLAVAALSDGTVRWYRMSGGAEMLALFPHRNEIDWIAWIPSGYYMSSLYGDNYIGWHLNRGKDGTPDFYRAVQFERVLYRPDLVVAALQDRSPPTTRASARFDVSQLPSILPPRIRIESAKLDGERADVLQIKFSVEHNSLPMKDYAIYVNNVPVTPRNDRRLKPNEARAFTRKLSLALPDRLNTIRIEVFNDKAMGVAEHYVRAAERRNVPPVGDLYLLAVGVNHFPQLARDIDLSYAAQDAEEIAASVQRAARGYYQRVHTQVLSDLSAVKADGAKIKEALQFVQNAQGDDTVMIFLASHGISDAAGNYYFLPRDATPEDVESVLKGAADEARPSLLSWRDFFDALRNAAGRRVLIVDTCQAKNIEGRFDAHSLTKRSAASRFGFVLASKGNEESQEYEPAGHGLFTYALISALGAVDNREGLISMNEWFGDSIPVVERLRDKTTGAQTPQLLAPEQLGAFPLLRRGQP